MIGGLSNLLHMVEASFWSCLSNLDLKKTHYYLLSINFI